MRQSHYNLLENTIQIMENNYYTHSGDEPNLT